MLTIAFFSWKFLENKIDKIFSPTHDFFFQETSSPEFLLGEDFCVNATVYCCVEFCPHGCICSYFIVNKRCTSKGAKTKSALGYEKPIIFDMIFFCS